MERAIGEIFTFRRKKVRVLAAHSARKPWNRCTDCVLNNVWCANKRYENKFGKCTGSAREDNTNVYFKQL